MALYAILIYECMVFVNMWQCQRESSHGHNRLLNLSDPLFDPALLLVTHRAGWVTYSAVLPLTVLHPLCFCIQIKTMASTSSVSQVSAQTWSWDNLPRSSFLAHQMRANVCLSVISFTFSHLLCTFIIQIRMLSGKMDRQKDRRCCRPCSQCASPLATMRLRVV